MEKSSQEDAERGQGCEVQKILLREGGPMRRQRKGLEYRFRGHKDTVEFLSRRELRDRRDRVRAQRKLLHRSFWGKWVGAEQNRRNQLKRWTMTEKRAVSVIDMSCVVTWGPGGWGGLQEPGRYLWNRQGRRGQWLGYMQRSSS